MSMSYNRMTEGIRILLSPGLAAFGAGVYLHPLPGIRGRPGRQSYRSVNLSHTFPGFLHLLDVEAGLPGRAYQDSFAGHDPFCLRDHVSGVC